MHGVDEMKQNDVLIQNYGLYVVNDEGTPLPANPLLFHSWTGHRLVWGVPYHGPVTPGGPASGVVWRGSRVCDCEVCQSTVTVSTPS